MEDKRKEKRICVVYNRNLLWNMFSRNILFDLFLTKGKEESSLKWKCKNMEIKDTNSKEKIKYIHIRSYNGSYY